MVREKADVWGCKHALPIEVIPLGDGRRARCLTCGQCGPVRPDSAGALRALRGPADRREKVGA